MEENAVLTCFKWMAAGYLFMVLNDASCMSNLAIGLGAMLMKDDESCSLQCRVGCGPCEYISPIQLIVN